MLVAEILEQRKMGNVMNSAVSAADAITSVHQPEVSNVPYHGTHKPKGKPPPECPMHKSMQEEAPPMYSSECPINDMAPNEINPLNMVNILVNVFENENNSSD